MDGFPTTRWTQRCLTPAQSAQDHLGRSQRNDPLTRQLGQNSPCKFLDTADSSHLSQDEESVAYADDGDHSHLLRSFDMIFRLHQRSEEIRASLDRIDRILLNSRTVAGLIESVVTVLENELDLVAVRVLFTDAHPLATILADCVPLSVGTVPVDVAESGGFFRAEPFVLDDPSGDLAYALFGESSALVSSAVVASLGPERDELGLLCLGSADPSRYCGGMNTDLIAELADKLALGIRNAWDHETRIQRALVPGLDGIYSEPFFREYLHKEFNRAWRHHACFCLMAVSWRSCPPSAPAGFDEVPETLLKHVRSADLVALGELINLWILMPETDLPAAKTVADRLIAAARDRWGAPLSLYIGITGFSRCATVASLLTRHARLALDEAVQHPTSYAVIREIPLPDD